MLTRYCGNCGAKTRSIAQVRLIERELITETRWCPQCGSIGVREAFLNRMDEAKEYWQKPVIAD